MSRVAVLHPGEMGAAVGAALVETGHEVVWLPVGRSEATRRRAVAAGLVEADDLDGCDVVLSVCPPGAAVELGRSVAGFAGLYVDANAVSPAAAEAVAATVEKQIEYLTPNDTFFTVKHDNQPQLSAVDWRLGITGLVVP